MCRGQSTKRVMCRGTAALDDVLHLLSLDQRLALRLRRSLDLVRVISRVFVLILIRKDIKFLCVIFDIIHCCFGSCLLSFAAKNNHSN